MNLSLTVYGTPIPQGSTKAFMRKGARFPVVTADNKKTKPWRQEIASTAEAQLAGQPPTPDAVEVAATFSFAKPKSAPKRVTQKTTKPDADKLLRALLDALTGIAFHDDSQVVDVRGKKLFGLPERVEFTVRTADGGIEV